MAADTRIGTSIKRARERKRWTQRQLAEAVDVNIKTVDNWENGRTSPRSSIGALEEILGVSFDSEPPAAIVPEYEWERLLLMDETLPYAERVQIIRVTRRARADGAPAPGPRSAGDGRAAQARDSRAG